MTRTVPNGMENTSMSGEPGDRAERTGLSALTRREIEITRLAATGLTIAAIAQRLFRSPKTIENHIHSAYRKLGVSNRVELANAARRLGIGGEPDRATTSRLVRSELAGKARALDLLSELDARLSVVPSDKYFVALLASLSEVLGVRFAGLSETDPAIGEYSIIAACDSGEIVDAPVCPLDRAPCFEVIERGVYVCESGLGSMHRGHPTVESLELDSFVGVRLEDAQLGLVGTLWVADPEKMEDVDLIVTILRFFAARTASELAMQKTLDELHRIWDENGV